jgi:flagellin
VFNTTTGVDNGANITAAGGGNNAGTADTGTFTFANAADATGTSSITIAGVQIDVDVTSGDLAVDTATAFADAINNNQQLRDLKITAATGGTATVTVTSNNSFDTYAIESAVTGGGAQTNTIGAGAAAELTKRALDVTFSAVSLSEGDAYRVEIGGANFDYVAAEGDTLDDVAQGLANLINSNASMVSSEITAQVDTSGATPVLSVDNGSGASVTFTDAARSDSTQAGGLRGLEAIDVTTGAAAKAALVAMEGLIQESINAAAHFGSAQGRIQTQDEFVSKIMDGLSSGIGALVDADMEAASARLQALQVQQQLGIQALSIANQQPQNILALFRQ